MVTSGIRIGEALGLVLGDLDRTHSLVRVESQLDRNGIRTPLKTGESRRVIDIPEQLIQRLVAVVAERGALFDPHALVFANRTGGGLERKVARNARKRTAENAGIAAPAPCLHDLRHSHASMLISLGIPVTNGCVASVAHVPISTANEPKTQILLGHVLRQSHRRVCPKRQRPR